MRRSSSDMFSRTALAHCKISRGYVCRGTRVRSCSVVSAIVLALSIQKALPIVGLVHPLRIDVDKDLHITTEERLPALERREHLRPTHEPANGAANDGWGWAPSVRVAGENV